METNFWGFILDAMQSAVTVALSALPHHVDIGMDALVVDLMGTTPILLFVIVNQFINLTVVILVWTTILTLEAVRAAYAAYMWIKTAIPFLG
jgi:hypothetical protein